MQNYHNAPINVSAIFPARAGDSVHANKKRSLAKERYTVFGLWSQVCSRLELFQLVAADKQPAGTSSRAL